MEEFEKELIVSISLWK